MADHTLSSTILSDLLLYAACLSHQWTLFSALCTLTVYTETVITFAAPKEKEDIDTPWKLGDLRSNIYRDVNGDYARQCDDCFDFAALVVFHAVKALLDITDDDSLQVFRIFEEYISVLVGQPLPQDLDGANDDRRSNKPSHSRSFETITGIRVPAVLTCTGYQNMWTTRKTSMLS